jgi:general secretion pathway protein D
VVNARLLRGTVLGLLVAVGSGCATGRAISRAESAVERGDLDAAAAYYRQALTSRPGDIELRIALERVTRAASAAHVARARELEADDQLAGAIAEYRLAADLDPTNTLAATKALQLERQMRDLAEAALPPDRIETLRLQAAQTSPIPRLDPRTRVPLLRFPNAAIRDILAAISGLTQINITYDQDPGLNSILSRAFSIDGQDIPLQEALHQVLSTNQLTFKVLNPTTIFVYQDTPQKRLQYDDVYAQTFYLSHADATEIQGLINQMVITATAGGVRPTIAINKGLNAISVKATLPVLEAIDAMIRANDKPRAEVLIKAEILEVNRNTLRRLGIDLSNYALGFTFSPELAPPNTSGTFPPSVPPPFNLNTISRGASASDLYVTVPTALIDLLETDTTTKVLAESTLRGREGQQMSLRLGDLVPIPQTTFQSQGAGGAATIPVTQVQYQPVGVNLTFTPRVTFGDEIIIDQLTLANSGLGNFLDVGGQSFPTITERTAISALRLRDGESNLLAGLLREQDRTGRTSLPGITSLPILRWIFGNTERSSDQTDIVMVLTPHIIRSHELTPEDLQPIYVGTGQNFGLQRVPSLISPDAPPPPETLPPAGPVPAPAPGGVAAPAPGAQTPAAGPQAGELPPAMPPAAGGATAGRAPGVVAIEPVGPGAAPAAPQAGVAQIALAAGAQQQAGGPPFTVPIMVSNVADLATISVTVTYDTTLLRPANITSGTFMQQGGVNPTFVPRVDAAAGRIDLAVVRGGGAAGVSGQGLLAAIQFEPLAAGSAQIAVSAVAATSAGQAIDLRPVPVTVTIR